MAANVIMPKAGMAMEEGTIIKWFKEVGEWVEKGEPLLEIETDKVDMEVEAMDEGYLIKKLNEEGDTVPVTQVIGYIGEKDEKVVDTKELVLMEAKEEQGQASEEETLDVVVIGGGPAGYVAAIKAAQLGGKVAVVEKDVVGGTCLNRGCIPTKTYLKTAEIIEHLEHADRRGVMINDRNFDIDMDKAIDMKNDVVKTLTGGVASLLKSHGIKICYGTGKINGNKEVVVDDGEVLKTKKIILAGGSKVNKIPIPGLESTRVLTSDDILDFNEVPDRLAVIGGGVIGVEMAVIFNSYGTHVTIIEVEDRIVPFMDEEISKELTKALEKKGIDIKTGTRLEKVEEVKDELTLFLDGDAILTADNALLSIGRVPDLEGIGDLDFELKRGKIKVDERMATSVKGIYAPGDINGLSMLAHAAFKMGETAAANAMGHEEKVNLNHVPSCIYTLPEVGAVGLTESEARKSHEISIGKFPFGGNGRALASGSGSGFVKVITDKKYGEVLGVHIIGPGAAEMINEAATLMAMEITAEEIADIIHGHPTYSEAFMEATADSLGRCLHLPKK